MTTETAREEAVNPLLGQLLRARGIKARAERRSRGDAPDIRFELTSGELVLIECKWEYNQPALNDQLDQRVKDFPDAIARVGVLYPEALKTEDRIICRAPTHLCRTQPIPPIRATIPEILPLERT